MLHFRVQKAIFPTLVPKTEHHPTKHYRVQEMICASSSRLLQRQSLEHCELTADWYLDMYPPVFGMPNRRSCALYYSTQKAFDIRVCAQFESSINSREQVLPEYNNTMKYYKRPPILLRPPSIFHLTTNPHNLLPLQPSVIKIPSPKPHLSPQISWSTIRIRKGTTTKVSPIYQRVVIIRKLGG